MAPEYYRDSPPGNYSNMCFLFTPIGQEATKDEAWIKLKLRDLGSKLGLDGDRFSTTPDGQGWTPGTRGYVILLDGNKNWFTEPLRKKYDEANK